MSNIAVPGAKKAMEQMKNEIASQLGINYSGDPGALTTRQNGSVGGEMVKRLISQAESQMK